MSDSTAFNSARSLSEVIREQTYSALRAYADEREHLMQPLVGQFVDSSGVADGQHGVYGMSAWVSLANVAPAPHSTVLKNLARNCSQSLASSVGDALNAGDIATLHTKDDDAAYEIRVLTPKASAVLEAFATSSTAEHDVVRVKLEQLIIDGGPDGRWSFVLDERCQSAPAKSTREERDVLIASALVLRSLRLSANHKGKAHKHAEVLLQRIAALDGDPVSQLFVLNAIFLAYDCGPKLGTVRRRLLETLRKLYRAADDAIIACANPVNFDFHADRIRNFRLPGDIVLLESLAILSGRHLLFVEAGPARAVLERLHDCVKDAKFDRDTSGHRQAITSVAYYDATLRYLLNRKPPLRGFPYFLRRPLSWALLSWHFDVLRNWKSSLGWVVLLFLLFGAVRFPDALIHVAVDSLFKHGLLHILHIT